MYDPNYHIPTNAGMLVSGYDPLQFLPRAYVQYVKFSGPEMTSGVQYEKRFTGPLILELNNIEEFIKSSMVKERPLKNGFKKNGALPEKEG